jgi:hypothetical protein
MVAKAKRKSPQTKKTRGRVARGKGVGGRAITGKARPPATRRPASTRKWSASVAQHSDALDLPPGIFKLRSARRVALALKKSAEESRRRKSTPFRSAMSMLNFEMNRAGKGLSASRRRVLEQTKIELRRVFHRTPV